MKNNKINGKSTIEILPRVDRFFLGSRYGKRGPLQNQTELQFKRLQAALTYYNQFQQLVSDGNKNNYNNYNQIYDEDDGNHRRAMNENFT